MTKTGLEGTSGPGKKVSGGRENTKTKGNVMDFMGRRGGKWVKMKKQSIWDKGKTKTQKRVG